MKSSPRFGVDSASFASFLKNGLDRGLHADVGQGSNMIEQRAGTVEQRRETEERDMPRAAQTARDPAPRSRAALDRAGPD
jgi:hypothetical protein